MLTNPMDVIKTRLQTQDCRAEAAAVRFTGTGNWNVREDLGKRLHDQRRIIRRTLCLAFVPLSGFWLFLVVSLPSAPSSLVRTPFIR